MFWSKLHWNIPIYYRNSILLNMAVSYRWSVEAVLLAWVILYDWYSMMYMYIICMNHILFILTLWPFELNWTNANDPPPRPFVSRPGFKKNDWSDKERTHGTKSDGVIIISGLFRLATHWVPIRDPIYFRTWETMV